jgi:hypothetical protein
MPLLHVPSLPFLVGLASFHLLRVVSIVGHFFPTTLSSYVWPTLYFSRIWLHLVLVVLLLLEEEWVLRAPPTPLSGPCTAPRPVLFSSFSL